MRKLFLLCIPIVFLCGLGLLASRSPDPVLQARALSRHAFDDSLGVQELGSAFVLHRHKDKQIRNLARQLIEMRKREYLQGTAASIPQIIHQIWTSDAPLPDHLARASRMLQQQHPKFRYILWRPCDFSPLLKNSLGPLATSLPPEVLRDVVASVVLLQFGGIVVDLEAECVHPITPLLSLGDCLIGFEPPLAKTKGHRRLFLSSAVIAAAPAHPLIKSYLGELSRRVQLSIVGKKIDPHWITQDALTTVASQISPGQGRTLLLGPYYFCPVSPDHIRHLKKLLDCEVRRNVFQKILKTLHLSSTPLYSELKRETIFVHMSGGRMGRHFFDISRAEFANVNSEKIAFND